MLNAWLVLVIAIAAEVAGSTMLMKAEQFTRLVPSVLTVLLYVLAFYCLSLSLRHISLGIAYSVWAGVGILLTVMVGFFIFKQSIDLAAVVGIFFIITGVIIINTLSTSISH